MLKSGWMGGGWWVGVENVVKGGFDIKLVCRRKYGSNLIMKYDLVLGRKRFLRKIYG